MMFFLLLTACTAQQQKSDSVPDEDEIQPPFGLLKIEEVYYAGSVPTAGIDQNTPINSFS